MGLLILYGMIYIYVHSLYMLLCFYSSACVIFDLFLDVDVAGVCFDYFSCVVNISFVRSFVRIIWGESGESVPNTD